MLQHAIEQAVSMPQWSLLRFDGSARRLHAAYGGLESCRWTGLDDIGKRSVIDFLRKILNRL